MCVQAADTTWQLCSKQRRRDACRKVIGLFCEVLCYQSIRNVLDSWIAVDTWVMEIKIDHWRLTNVNDGIYTFENKESGLGGGTA